MISRGPVRPSCGPRSPPRTDLGGIRCVVLMCRRDALPLRIGGGTRHIGPQAHPVSHPMHQVIQKVLLGILVLFLLPLAVHAALYASKDRPASFRDADWSSVGMLPPPDIDREARFLVFTGRTGRWKGIFAVHSWVVFKPTGADAWSRYDVVGWGQPVRANNW